MLSIIEHRFKPLLIHDSYYPELPKKSKFKQYVELLGSLLSTGFMEKYYYAYGLDCKGKKLNDYINSNTFRKIRDGKNRVQPYDYICILRDKELFSSFGKSKGIPVVGNLSIIKQGQVLSEDNRTLKELCSDYHHLFCKPADAGA